MRGIVKQAGWMSWGWALLLAATPLGAAEPVTPAGDNAAEAAAAETPAPAATGAAGAVTPTDFGAAQRIVVSATRIEMPIQNVPTSTSVITESVIAERQYREAGEALQSMRGLSVRSTGGVGSQTSVFTRGLPSQYTKVMRDGMPMNDPSTPQGTYDFGGATTTGLSQLEVLRGPQSLLHGSNAVGGLVNMVTKKGEGCPTGYVTAEGGSFGTARTLFGASAGSEKGDFALSGSALAADGVSAYDKRQYGFTEKDGYKQGDLSLRLGANPIDNLRFDLFAYGQKSRVELDSGWTEPGTYNYAPYDDPDAKQDVDRCMIRPQITWELFDGRWEQKVGFGYAATERRYKDEPDPGPFPSMNRLRYLGETTKFDYQSVVRLHETNTLLVGIDVVTESMETQSVRYGPGTTPTLKYGNVTDTGIFLEDRVDLGDVFSAGAGVRYDHHDDFGDHWTWKTDAQYRLPTATVFKASVGTGFRAPGLYERYGDQGVWVRSNDDLGPETSVGWDAGFEQGLFCERFTLGGDYFENYLKDMIVYQSDPRGWAFPGWYENVGKVKTWGIEAFFRYEIIDGLSLSGQYTWTRARNRLDPGDKNAQLRRPLNEASVNLDYRFLEKGTFTTGMKYVGRRWDRDSFAGEDVRMPSYTTFRVAAAWQFNPHVEVFGRVENLFDKKYQDVFGYGATGIGLFGGATVSF